MGLYQCQEYRRDINQAVCKATTTTSDTQESNMSDAQESNRHNKCMSDMKGKYDYSKSIYDIPYSP